MCVLLIDFMEAHGGLEGWSDVRSIDVELDFSGASLDSLISGRTSLILNYLDVAVRQ